MLTKFFESDVDETWEAYSIGAKFASALVSKELVASRILNLNLLPNLLAVIVWRHRTIVGQSNIKGPFYLKARIENVWRTVPFVDLDGYMEHVERFDFPVVQEADMIVPKGTSLETFLVLPESEDVPAESNKVGSEGSIAIWVEIMQALGIPGELLAQNAEKLLSVALRESEMHRARATR